MKKNKLKLCIQLLLSFMKIGVVTFGGGYAMIPIIENETNKRRKWISEEDLLEVVAISESTPGAIGVNMSTYVGFHVAGIAGALITTFGFVLGLRLVGILYGVDLMMYMPHFIALRKVLDSNCENCNSFCASFCAISNIDEPV